MVDKVKRLDAPRYPAMIKYSESTNVMIVDFLNHVQDDMDGNEEYETFSSIIITSDMAKNMLSNLYNFVTEQEAKENSGESKNK